MITSFLVWYLVLQAFAFAGLPLAFAWLRNLPSRGYAASKVLGLLLSGVIFWWGGILHLWENTTAAALSAAGIVFAVGIWGMRGHWEAVRPWWRTHRAFVITTEALFLGCLLLWAIVRASQPQLETAGGEKWMEIGFLNAVLRSPSQPPHDPWLSGYAISYYYLGYLLLGMITRVAAVPATIAFNLGNVAWFALAAVGAYGIVYDLRQRNDAARPLLAPLMLLVVGNGEGFLEALHARGLLPAAFWAWLDIRGINAPPEPPFSWAPTRFFWWWQASRTLHDYTPWGEAQEVIDEFPAFSFTLGDMHPHVLALPFVLLVVALALNLYRQSAAPPRSRSLPDAWRRFAPLAGYALLLGALGFLNTWDFPIYWALMVGALVLGAQNLRVGQAADRGADARARSLFDALWSLLPEAVVLGVLSVVFYFPFWIALRSQAGGVLPNLFNATRLPQFVVMFAPFLAPVIGVIIAAARATRIAWRTLALWSAALLVGIALASLLIGSVAAYPYLQAVLHREPVQGILVDQQTVVTALVQRLLNPWTALLLTLGGCAAVLAMMGRERGNPLPETLAFPLLLVLIGLLLTLAPEFVFLKDVFTTRMNTIFKFYFQAWVLWSLAGAWQLSRWLDLLSEEERPTWPAIALGLSACLIAAGLVYTLLAVPARAKEHGAPWTLDGGAWLAESRPEDYLAIHWLNANITGWPVIVEAPGDRHRAYVYEGRVSALTGLPTVLGWAGHEWQWRGTYDEQARRELDLETLFTTSDSMQARAILARYEVAYIYIGPVERARYPVEGLAKFAALFPAVYDRDGVVIYRVTP